MEDLSIEELMSALQTTQETKSVVSSAHTISCSKYLYYYSLLTF